MIFKIVRDSIKCKDIFLYVGRDRKLTWRMEEQNIRKKKKGKKNKT